MNFSWLLVLEILLVLGRLNSLLAARVPVLPPSQPARPRPARAGNDTAPLKYLPLTMLIGEHNDTSEFWRETDILTLVLAHADDLDPERCRATRDRSRLVRFPSRRNVRPICRGPNDHQLCPQCPFFSNDTECELFRDSCKERKVQPAERSWYCERKYGRGRAVLIPADPAACRCCDECVFYRELDQSCMEDEYHFDAEESLPVSSIDFRAGCNPYWGHPEQETRALRCDTALRRCVPVSAPAVPPETMQVKRKFRFEPPPPELDCPLDCRGYSCRDGSVEEAGCRPGAFLPDKHACNCCGKCSPYQQLNEKCAEFKKTEHTYNGTKEIEVEEEFLEPGCDDALVCRRGRCRDIHAVPSPAIASTSGPRRKRDDAHAHANEPCKLELKLFKKKYGADGHLHYNAPQCTPLWLYAPVQCRRFVCYCALEDGSFIRGIKVPRVEVSNMNCDCAREKCRTNSDVECDGYGNYKEAVFTEWAASTPPGHEQQDSPSTPAPGTSVQPAA